MIEQLPYFIAKRRILERAPRLTDRLQLFQRPPGGFRERPAFALPRLAAGAQYAAARGTERQILA
jgi:hypothetical protein